MSKNYAIISYRETGPIKTMSDLRGAQVHNFREKPIAHGDVAGLAPVLLFGSGDLVADVKAKLLGHGIDPNNVRENGVLAYEAVATASPTFFRNGSAEEQQKRLDAWTTAQVEFAKKKYGRGLASMVLHLDEETPHVHLIVVPLALVDDKRRKERGWRYSLVGSTISGPGQFDQLQDEYAEAMAPFGLSRGERHSGQKHESYAALVARVSERERLARNAEAAADEQRVLFLKMSFSATEQLAVADRAIAEADRRRKVADEDIRKAAEQAMAAERARLLNIKRSDELLKGWREFNEEEAELGEERDKARAGIEQNAADAAMIADAVRQAAAFTRAFESIDRASLPLSLATTLQAADALTADRSLMPTDRYGAAASPRTVPLPIWRQDSGMGA